MQKKSLATIKEESFNQQNKSMKSTSKVAAKLMQQSGQQTLKQTQAEEQPEEAEQIQHLINERNSWKAKYEQSQRVNGEEIQSLNALIKRLKTNEAELKKAEEEQSTQLLEKTKQIKLLERKTRQQEQDINENRQKYSDIDRYQDQMKEKIKLADKQIKELLVEQARLQNIVQTKETSSNELSEQIKQLDRQNNQIQRENDKLVIELQTRTEQLNFKIDTWMTKAQQYKQDLDTLKLDMKHLDNTCRIEMDKKNDYKVQLNSIKNQLAEFDELTRRLAQKDKYIKELENDVDDLKRQIRKNPNKLIQDYEEQNTQELIFRLQNDVRILQMEVDTKKQEAKTWQNKALELEEIIKGKKHFEEERVFLEREIHERDLLIQNLKERLDIAQKEIEILNRRLATLGNYYPQTQELY